MAEILGGLALIGKVISDRTDNAPVPHIKQRIRPKTTGNIYNSNQIRQTKKNLQKMADSKWNAAKNPEETGVIPKYYNRINRKTQDCDSVFSDECNISDSDVDERPLYEKGNDLLKKNREVEHFMNTRMKTSSPGGNDTFLNQFEPLSYDNPADPVAQNKVPEQVGNISRLSMERDLSLQNGFSKFGAKSTYNVIPEDKMTHNNMTPDFRPKKGYGFSIDEHQHINDLSQRKMDLYTGSLGNLEYRPKTERKPLFNPMIGLTHIYGEPVRTSEYESRFIPSRERRNEKPFQETRVTPGLNLGFNEVGRQGYQDPYRTTYKTVNELRTLNNPKLSYTTPVVHQLKGARQPTVPVVPKRRPMTFEEYGTTRMLPQFNSELSAPTIDGEYDPDNMATINRGTQERVTHGPAQFTYTLNTPDSMYPLVHESTKENFEDDGPRNTTMVQAQQARGFNDSWNAPMTQRMQPNEYVGPMFHQNTNKMYAFDTLDNIPDPNMRTIHENTEHFGAIGTSQYDKHVSFDSNNAIPDPNMRNIHSETDRYGSSIGTSQYEKRQAFDTNNAIPDPNMRNIHSEYDRAGANVGQSQYYKPQAFDTYNAIPDPNMRTIHLNANQYGTNVGNGQYSRSYAFDSQNAVSDPNMRNIHSEYDRAGTNVGQSQYYKPQAFDTNNAIPDPNMRNIHSEYDRSGIGMGQGQYSKHVAFNATNATPDPNMRTIHVDTDRYGKSIGNSQYHKQQAFDKHNATPDPTMRDMNVLENYCGTLGASQTDKPQAFDSYNAVPDPTMRDIYQFTDRAGFVGNGQLDKTIVFDMSSNIPDPTLREIHIDNNHVGTAGYHEAQTNRADVRNAHINVIKEPIGIGRAPTTCNFQKCPSMEGTMVQLCDNVQVNREFYPDIKQQVTPKMPTMYTRSSHELPNDEWHFDSHVVDNLNKNVYINNTQHVSHQQ